MAPVIAPPAVADSAQPADLLKLVERTIGITLSGLVLIVVAVVGWLLAHVLGGRVLYLAAYAGLAMLGTAIYLARRKRPVYAVRSELARRGRGGPTPEGEVKVIAKARVAPLEGEGEPRP